MSEIDLAERDRIPLVWDLSQERQFLAAACDQRFNFFLGIFGVVVGGAAAAKSHFFHRAILCIGASICTMFCVVLRRGLAELRVVTRHPGDDPGHSVALIRRDLPGASPIRLMSNLIPLIRIGTLIAGAVMAMLTSRSHTGPPTGSMGLDH